MARNTPKLTLGRIFHPRAIPALARFLLQDEAISGKLILVATALALILANSPWQPDYEAFWNIHFGTSADFFGGHLNATFRHWVNEGLMVFFFLMVCLEVKRELVQGQLRKFRAAVLPVAAAIGGLAIPALFYIAFNNDPSTFHGWAIPMSTDTALALGLLTLLGKRIPSALKLFLLTLAVVDDIGAVTVIAVFYGHGFNIAAFSVMIVLAAVLFSLRHTRFINIYTFALFGIGIWLALNATGIHASVTGAILGLLAPIRTIKPNRVPFTERLEKMVIPLVTLIVVPLFAFANAGIKIGFDGFPQTSAMITYGIVAGLVLGKLIGVTGTAYVLVKLRITSLPDGVRWPHMIGVGLLAGVGFTIAVFVTELTFGEDGRLMNVAKLSIIIASVLSGVAGLFVLRFFTKRRA